MSRRTTSPSAGDANTQAAEPAGDQPLVLAVNGDTPNTDISEQVASFNNPEIAAESAETSGVMYVGIADNRILTVSDLESIGVDNPEKTLEWSDGNGRCISIDELNEQTRKALLALPDFLAY